MPPRGGSGGHTWGGAWSVLSEILNGALESLTSRDLAQAVALDDAGAIRAARFSARYTGVALGGVINVLDPAVVVIGGGIGGALGPRYVDWAVEMARRVPIVASQLGDDAGLPRQGLEAS
jgi:predicted NBD/HSP70 family sugar kinase